MKCFYCNCRSFVLYIDENHKRICEDCYMGKLNEYQWRFCYLTSFLIQYAFLKGYKLRYDDAYATSGHKVNSYHYKHLAVDFSLYDSEGNYCAKTEDHKFLGEFWESLDKNCTWGGRFSHKDGNHYSFTEGK